MSSQAKQDDGSAVLSTGEQNVGPLGRFARTLSTTAIGYFSPTKDGDTLSPAPTSRSASAPRTPAVGDVLTKPTPFQRFLNLGKVRKDWEVEFPPSHWDRPGEGSEAPAPHESPRIGVLDMHCIAIFC